MDLPWEIIWDKIKILFHEIKKKNKNKEILNNENGEENSTISKSNDTIKSSVNTSEEEMLRRFRLAINQSKSRTRVNSSQITPSPLNSTPFQLNPIEEK